MQCVKTVKYNILVSGNEIGEVIPSRGLRQRDPLSPYLFLFVSDVFSRMVRNAVKEKRIKGLEIAKLCPELSHLFFADDSLFYVFAEEDNCRQLKSIIAEYCKASGQKINCEKSTLYFSPNTGEDMKKRICEILEMKETNDPSKYLGLPSIWGRSKVEALSYIKERVLAKLKGWKREVLSTAGREILIKAVATSIPAYPMSVFKFPKGHVRRLMLSFQGFGGGRITVKEKYVGRDGRNLLKGS